MTQTALPPTGTDMVLHDNTEATALMPLLSIDQAVARYNAVVEFAKKVLKPGRDYGEIPGTEHKRGGDKNDEAPSSKNHTLLKPGAEKLCTLFGLMVNFEDYRVIEDWDKGLFYYAYRCVLSRGGRSIAGAIGSANSRERKYRRGARTCPECGAAAIKRSRFAKGSEPAGFYCEDRSGGCGKSFPGNDTRILDQTMKIDPLEAADQINTLQKMAQKRALVAATLIATNASEFFTQDVEDMPYAGNEEEPDDVPRETASRTPSPLLKDDAFIEEWRLAIAGRQHTNATADTLLAGLLNKRALALSQVDLAGREELLAKAQDGKFDKLCQQIVEKMSKPAETPPGASHATPPSPESATRQASPPAATVANSDPYAEVESWDLFLENARTAAADVPEETFDNGIRVALGLIQKTGKPETTSKPWRLERLRAIRAKAFDWATAKINQVQAAIG